MIRRAKPATSIHANPNETRVRFEELLDEYRANRIGFDTDLMFSICLELRWFGERLIRGLGTTSGYRYINKQCMRTLTWTALICLFVDMAERQSNQDTGDY